MEKRIYEHKNKLIKGFTSRYGVHTRVYYEETGDITVALQREKRLKKVESSMEVISTAVNPYWNDLVKDWIRFRGNDIGGDKRGCMKYWKY